MMNRFNPFLLSTFFVLICFQPISAQDLLGVEIGGFFEQLYGGETDEEGIDLCKTQNEYLMVGWTDFVYEEHKSKDATIWYTDKLGGEVYSKHLGTSFKDEVATGVVSVTPEYFAICVHESSNFNQDSVKNGDRLWVYYLETASGNVIWSDVIEYEESGVAPSDIQYDGSGNLFVLANHLNSSGGTMTEIYKYDLQGNNLWISQPYYNSNLGHWSSELIINTNNTLATMPYNYDLKSPEAVVFNANGTIINVNTYQENSPTRVYGVIQEPATSQIIGVGYTIGEENDTNAYLIQLDGSLAKINSFQFGVFGVEKFRDITSTVDGYICAGVRNNKGEGGYDCYIDHLNFSFVSFFDETFGGKTDDRLSSIIIDEFSSKAWFSGYNKEYTISSSGNAYVGGITTQLASSQVQCEIPRVMLIDRLVDKTQINTWRRLNHWSVVRQKCQDLGVNIVFLYDVDKIFAPNSGANSNTKEEVFRMIRDFMWHDIKVGMIAGPDISKLRAISDIMNGVTTTSIQLPGKVNYIMLEHEFWNFQDDEDMVVLNPNAYNASWGNDNPYKILKNSGYNYSSMPDEHKYYWHLTKDHKKLLDDIDALLPNNKNWWKSMDYIGYLKRIDNPYKHLNDPNDPNFQAYPNSIVYYDIGSSNINSLSVSPTVQNHREALTEQFISVVDFTFLVNYRNANIVNHFINANNVTGVPNYAFSLPGEDFHERHEAYAAKASFAKDQVTQKFNFIPLFSNEQTSCIFFGDTGTAQLGPWLGGNSGTNSYQRNEQAYYTQWAQAPATCVDCVSETQLAAFGWFKYGCISAHGIFLPPTSNPSSNPNARIQCGAGNIIPLSNDSEVTHQQFSAFPNPAKDFITLSFEDDLNYNYSISNLNGVIVKSGSANSSQNMIDLRTLPNGLYLLSLEGVNYSGALKIMVTHEN